MMFEVKVHKLVVPTKDFENIFSNNINFYKLLFTWKCSGSVIFGTDPDPRIRTTELRNCIPRSYTLFFSGFKDAN
jgi:hypothetical protein